MSKLRDLPSTSELLQLPDISNLVTARGHQTVLAWIRESLSALRHNPEGLGDRKANTETVALDVLHRAAASRSNQLGGVINATGVVLHTGLGRAPLAADAVRAIADLSGAGNVEVDLTSGARRYRGHQLQPLWQQLTGCEDSLIVNNNAAATLLTLQAMCAGREVIISRGQLIEIGGSFRLPEIFELSGARLREVGTTNRTRLSDYEQAIGPETAAIMHVHPSNYRVVGFTSVPEIAELVELARARDVPTIDDIGSGSLVDVTRWGLPREPTFPESISAGADVVLGSGDKLLGGPQAGIILGRREWVERIRNAPFARTVRVDKLTLAALAATLDIYARDQAEDAIPVLNMLSRSPDDLLDRATRIAAALGAAESVTAAVEEGRSLVGGGSLPGVEMPTVAVTVTHARLTADQLALSLRTGQPRVFPRIHDDRVLLDLRSVSVEDDERLIEAVRSA